MQYQPELIPDATTSFDICQAADLYELPTFWAINNFLPMHRLSLILAPSGQGLTQLACHLAACMAPPHQEEPSPLLAQREAEELFYRQEEEELTQPGQFSAFNDHLGNPRRHKRCEPSFATSDRPTVLMISQRDTPDILRPRLTSLGAHLRDILILSQVTQRVADSPGQSPHEVIRPFQPRDHEALSELLHENKSIRLVIIDNADWMFSATNHPSRAQLQRQLACLEAVADQREVAIVLLTSIPALTANPFSNRLLQTLRDVCRTVHLLAPDLQDPSSRLLFTLKNSLNPYSPTRRVHLFPAASPSNADLQHQFLAAPTLSSPSADASPLDTAASIPGPSSPHLPRLSPAHPPAHRLNTEPHAPHPIGPGQSAMENHLTYPHYLALLRRSHARGPAPVQHDFACEVLIESLKHGPLPIGNIRQPQPGTLASHACQANLSWGTFCRAKKTLQITSTNTPSGWFWALPQTIPLLPAASATESAAPGIPSPSSTETVETADPNPTNQADETCAPSPANSAQLPVNTASPTPPTPPGEIRASSSIPAPQPISVHCPPLDSPSSVPASPAEPASLATA